MERIPEGHSNLTFKVRRGQELVVLRRPPRGELLPSSHDVTREFRILTALHGGPVPVPRPLLLCEDPAVLGAPFYLMELVPGVSIRERLPAGFEASAASRMGLAERLVDTLAQIHLLDWRAAGLEGLGRPQGYLERQVRRWILQMWGAWNRDIPELSDVANWLQENVPASGRESLVHGDFRLDNVLFLPDPPATVTAVVDWEMGTLGDPLADLGYLLSFWRDPGDPEVGFEDGAWRITAQAGFPRRAWLVERYLEKTGFEVDDLRFYEVLAVWKLAILLEGSYRRFKEGMADDPWFALLEGGVPALARRALQMTGVE